MKIPYHENGTLVVIEGPRFSTKAESKMFRNFGADIIGMTMVPECVLAREAEICYASIATVTDYDVWKENKEVSVDEVLRTMKENESKVKGLIEKIIPLIPEERDCRCKDSLRDALI